MAKAETNTNPSFDRRKRPAPSKTKMRLALDALAEAIPEASQEELHEVAALLLTRCNRVSEYRDLAKGAFGWGKDKIRSRTRTIANKVEANLIFAAAVLQKLWATEYKRHLSDREVLKKIVNVAYGWDSEREKWSSKRGVSDPVPDPDAPPPPRIKAYQDDKSRVIERLSRRWRRMVSDGREPQAVNPNPLRVLFGLDQIPSNQEAVALVLKGYHKEHPKLGLFPRNA